MSETMKNALVIVILSILGACICVGIFFWATNPEVWYAGDENYQRKVDKSLSREVADFLNK